MARAAGTASRWQVFELMSAQRMTDELRKLSRLGRQVCLASGLAVLTLCLGGCGSGALLDKFMAKDDTFKEEPADKLYNEGLYLMNQNKDPKAASKKFEEVDRQHPYSDWARKSLLMSAYAFYNAGDFDNCIGAATRYVTLHPGSADAAYAQYLIAASHYDQIPDISRDQGRTEKAIAALEEVVRKYPTSEYATSAKAKLEGARDQLAGKEMNVGRYYMDKRDYTAAINRFKTVVTQYQTTRHPARPGPPKKGDRGAGGSGAKIPAPQIPPRRKGQAGGPPRPARRKGDECRPLLHGKARLPPPHHPLQARGDAIPAPPPC